MQALSQLSYTPTKGAHYTGRIFLCKEWETARFDNEISRNISLDAVRTVAQARMLPSHSVRAIKQKHDAHPAGKRVWIALKRGLIGSHAD